MDEEASIQNYDAYCAARQPMEQLPLALTVDYSAMRLPVKVALGFGTTIADLTAYVKRVELLTYEELLSSCQNRQYRDIYINGGIVSLERYLGWVTLERIDFKLWTPVHVKYDTVVTLWTNYTLPEHQLDDQDTKEVLDILRKELCLPEEEQPLWYFIKSK
ncbi:uncharacterized protein STEHIDRAFT_132908 [Stereum hirsutum FP-91666 SS1]|uniref:uncharacterized protein n=1 Tax=Stereum hirsutum (strain FP-91666) TaxID=721885 RepID=UPI0004449773|nr:uncharacterized protein STEHIDRAFT_132908 [Stereum hirsutum FP-91666 SS1]EIM83764.1 hypothetical protein STEHIDRAFT_132908 [Stereum hirsutum FP-91666 SS1]